MSSDGFVLVFVIVICMWRQGSAMMHLITVDQAGPEGKNSNPSPLPLQMAPSKSPAQARPKLHRRAQAYVHAFSFQEDTPQVNS